MQLQQSAWQHTGHWKLLLRCGVLGGARHFSAHRGEGRGHIVAAALLQLVSTVFSRFLKSADCCPIVYQVLFFSPSFP